MVILRVRYANSSVTRAFWQLDRRRRKHESFIRTFNSAVTKNDMRDEPVHCVRKRTRAGRSAECRENRSRGAAGCGGVAARSWLTPRPPGCATGSWCCRVTCRTRNYRGTEIAAPRSARCSAHVSHKHADNLWTGRHAWGDRSFHPDWNPFVGQASTRGDGAVKCSG